MTDPIADFLIRLKNAYLSKKREVCAPYSKVKEALAQVLKKQGFIEDVKKDTHDGDLKVMLKYKDGVPQLSGVTRISKPGLRRYAKSNQLYKLRQGQLGYVILSTPKGLMTHVQAKKIGVGGEIICAVW